MNKNLKYRILLILGIVAASLYFTFPLEKRINLGLDLKGGMHLVVRVETEKIPAEARTDAVQRAMEILRNRIDSLGVGETSIQRQGEEEIIIQLPGLKDRSTALELIGKVAQLEFKLVEKDPLKLKEALADKIPDGYELKHAKEGTEPILVEKKISLGGDAVKDAKVDFAYGSGMGEPYILLNLDSKGAKRFGDLTKAHVGERLAIVMDGEVLSAPTIQEPIMDGTARITGLFKFEEASVLAMALRSGALPAPMRIEEERTIGPLLGRDSINAGIRATIVGGVAVLIFMAIYYLVAGLVANVALILNVLLVTGAMGFMNVMMPGSQATLTLPGIAGIILTLGMAVDANVLINERIREELAIGRPLYAAINNGYHRAFSAIFDSNLTTIVAAVILFQFGSGPIKGFAVTLTIGLIASLFTAYYVTRVIFELLIHFKVIKTLRMLQFFPVTKIDFVAKRYFFYAVSVVVIVIGLFSFYTKKDKAYGVDFAGGQLQEYRFEKPMRAEDLRALLKSGGVEDAVIQQFEQNPGNVIIRTPADTYDQVVKIFKDIKPENKFEIMRIEKVGPVVGKLLKQKALLALIFALIGILGYVGFRFKHFDFAAAGVIALLHDVIVAAGLLVFFNHQIDLLVITALLTIAGFSINDTIVIYDRLRENLAKTRKLDLREALNLSVNQTLGRTVLTTSATMFTVVSLYLFGGEVLNTFSLCLIIGFLSGVYSTVFIATPLVLAWNGLMKKRR